MRTMVDMELDDESKMDLASPTIQDRPDYPWGLRISLTHTELEKLGLDIPEVEQVGGMVHGHFMARVTSISSNSGESGQCCRVELQIVALSVESEDLENEDDGED